MRLTPTMALSLFAITLAAGSSQASTRIYGNSMAATCSTLALMGESDRKTLDICTQSLENEAIGRDNAAKTYVNRGVIYLRRTALDSATRDFAQAERLMPDLPEIFVNRGVVLMKQKRWPEAIAQFDKGIALQPMELEKAYFNRALAREQLDDLRGAYADFTKAAQLKPDWEPPKKELLRYTVRRP